MTGATPPAGPMGAGSGHGAFRLTPPPTAGIGALRWPLGWHTLPTHGKPAGLHFQAVLYPLAAVAVGAGFYVVATSGTKKPAKTGLTFTPQAGPGGAKLDVLYTW